MFLCVFRENMSDKLEPPARLALEKQKTVVTHVFCCMKRQGQQVETQVMV